MSYITVRDVTVVYDGETRLNKVNLEVNEGEIIAVLGPSGFGKTTLLRVMTGLQIPLEGEVLVNGLAAPKALRQGLIAVSFQDATLLPWLSSRENAGWFSKMRTGTYPFEEITELEKLLCIDLRQKAWPQKLSGGERQRVSLMRALTMGAKVLAIDESFSALDYGMRRNILGPLRDRLKKTKTTTLFVTHDVRDAVHLADRLIVHASNGQCFDRHLLVDLSCRREATIRDGQPFAKVVDEASKLLEVP